MTQPAQRLTLAEFEAFVRLPENADRRFEYIGGEIHEVVSNNYSSQVAAAILILIGVFVRGNDSGYLTGADGGYTVAGERYMPDVAYISKARQPQPSHETYNSLAPDLAVEVLSPSDTRAQMRIKVANYLHAGTLLWLVDPETKQVEVYEPGKPVRIVAHNGTLTGSTVLPGFTLTVSEIFP